MATILVTGAKGIVGSKLVPQLLLEDYKVIAASHDDLDITDALLVQSVIKDTHVDAVINCAAMSDIEKAEENETLCNQVNAIGVKNLAVACEQCNIPLITFSSDQVFDGDECMEHSETDKICALSVYARSQVAAENYLKKIGGKNLVVRTSRLFSTINDPLIKELLEQGKYANTISIPQGRTSCPTPVSELVKAVCVMLKATLSPDFDSYGTYHYTGYPGCSLADFSSCVLFYAQKKGLVKTSPSIAEVNSRSLKLKASVPKDSRLKCDKCKQVFNLSMPDWRNYLEGIL